MDTVLNMWIYANKMEYDKKMWFWGLLYFLAFIGLGLLYIILTGWGVSAIFGVISFLVLIVLIIWSEFKGEGKKS